MEGGNLAETQQLVNDVSVSSRRNALKKYSSIISRSIIVLVLAMLCNGAPAAASGPGGIVIFDPNPDHTWNRTYSCLFVRYGPDGSEYGSDTVDPLFWPGTPIPLNR